MLRQSLWRDTAHLLNDIDTRLYEAQPSNATDKAKWIDTTTMIADPLTKAMNPMILVKVMDTGYWDFEQSEEAKRIKARKQAGRRSVAKDEPEVAEEPAP